MQRPLTATFSFASPFEVVSQPLVLKAKDRKAPDLGPKVRVEVARLSPTGDEAALAPLGSGAGLRDLDRDGLKEHDTDTNHMWCGTCAPGLALEFELPEAVSLGALEVYNYNAEWATTNGLRKADVSVSADGQTWQTVLKGVEFAPGEGTADYDEPVVLQLKGVTARKVRLENLVPWGTGGKVGLSAVVFHQAPGPQAGPLAPEDGANSVNAGKVMLRWVPGQGAREHRVFFGMAADKLEPLGTNTQAELEAPELKPASTYFWRVDEVGADGQVVKGRVAKFASAGLVGWWKLDEIQGTLAASSVGGPAGVLVGAPVWVKPGLKFNGSTDYVNCGTAAGSEVQNSLTLAAWINPNAFVDYASICTKGTRSSPYALQLWHDGSLRFTANWASPPGCAGEGAWNSSGKLNTNQWQHVAVTYDGSTVRFYLNGHLDSNQPKAALRFGAVNEPLTLGADLPGAVEYFNGTMRDVRVYGYALSPEEISTLCQGASTERAQK